MNIDRRGHLVLDQSVRANALAVIEQFHVGSGFGVEFGFDGHDDDDIDIPLNGFEHRAGRRETAVHQPPVVNPSRRERGIRRAGGVYRFGQEATVQRESLPGVKVRDLQERLYAQFFQPSFAEQAPVNRLDSVGPDDPAGEVEAAERQAWNAEQDAVIDF